MITIDKDTKHMKQQAGGGLCRSGLQRQVVHPPAGGPVRLCGQHPGDTSPATVKLKLYKGNIITAGVTSPDTLYSENLVTFEESDYNQDDATGLHQPLGPAGHRSGAAGAGETEATGAGPGPEDGAGAPHKRFRGAKTLAQRREFISPAQVK